jgi:hypothetical protein
MKNVSLVGTVNEDLKCGDSCTVEIDSKTGNAMIKKLSAEPQRQTTPTDEDLKKSEEIVKRIRTRTTCCTEHEAKNAVKDEDSDWFIFTKYIAKVLSQARREGANKVIKAIEQTSFYRN